MGAVARSDRGVVRRTLCAPGTRQACSLRGRFPARRSNLARATARAAYVPITTEAFVLSVLKLHEIAFVAPLAEWRRDGSVVKFGLSFVDGRRLASGQECVAPPTYEGNPLKCRGGCDEYIPPAFANNLRSMCFGMGSCGRLPLNSSDFMHCDRGTKAARRRSSACSRINEANCSMWGAKCSLPARLLKLLRGMCLA